MRLTGLNPQSCHNHYCSCYYLRCARMSRNSCSSSAEHHQDKDRYSLLVRLWHAIPCPSGITQNFWNVDLYRGRRVRLSFAECMWAQKMQHRLTRANMRPRSRTPWPKLSVLPRKGGLLFVFSTNLGGDHLATPGPIDGLYLAISALLPK